MNFGFQMWLLNLLIFTRNFKGAWSDISEWRFYSENALSSKKSWFQIISKNGQTMWILEEVMCIAIADTVLCKLNYGYHS